MGLGLDSIRCQAATHGTSSPGQSLGHWYSDDFTKAYFDDADHITYVQKLADMRASDHSIPAAGDAHGPGRRLAQRPRRDEDRPPLRTCSSKAEKKTFNYDCVYTPAGKVGQFLGAACSGWTIAAKAKNPDNSWPFVKFLVSEAKQCQIVSVQAVGQRGQGLRVQADPDRAATRAQFKAIFVDPLMARVQGDHGEDIPYPPFLSEIKQVMATEFDAVVNGGTSRPPMPRRRRSLRSRLCSTRARS